MTTVVPAPAFNVIVELPRLEPVKFKPPEVELDKFNVPEKPDQSPERKF